MNLNGHFENYRLNPSETLLAEVLKSSQFLIYSIAIKVVNHNQDAEDLTQEVLIKAIQNINLLPKNTNFIGWLNRIALNAAIDLYHQKKRIKTLSPGYQEFKKNNPNEKDDETIVIIYQHLAKLDGIEESLILNKFIHQMTYAQLSNLHKLPRTTIESKINNILSKLKVSIEKAGFAGVALALSSTLDQLKATEVVLDLLPRIKSNFPTNYPNSAPKSITNKIFSKPLLLVSSALVAFLIYGGLSFFNEQNKSPTEVVASQENPLKNTNPAIVDTSTTKVYSKNKVEESMDKNSSPIEKTQTYDTNVLPPANVDLSASLKTEYAGQLLDAVTKEPIVGAKLEIWDIYTYKKTETTTDAEGKYDIPNNLDKTFFFYLKFSKEGYDIKQTFQHFSTQTKIIVLMNKGEQSSGYLRFDEPTNGDIYIGMELDLNNELHLSNNQKENLAIVFNIILDIAPIELYTYKKVKMEAANEYFLKDIPLKNFVIWREGSNKRRSTSLIRLASEEEKVFFKKDKLYFQFTDSNNYSLESSKTGKLLTNIDLKIFDLDTRKDIFEKVGQKNKEESVSVNILEHSILTIDDTDYYAVTKQEPYYTVVHESKDFRALQLIPYSSISFEPLSLEKKLHNSQIIFENNFYSKNSIFKKCKEREGTLKVFDMYFEELIYKGDIKCSIGGNININHEVYSNSSKNMTISITINNNLLRNTNIEISNDKGLNAVYELPEVVKLDANGFGLFNRQKLQQKIKVEFQFNNTRYFKTVDLSQILNDQIKLSYNKSIGIQVSQELINSYAKAIAIVSDNRDYLSSNHIPNTYFFAENSYIAVPFSEKIVFVEEDTEYTASDAGYSIKTNFSRLKAIKTINIKSNVNEVEIKPIPDTDYISFNAKFVDQNGKEIKNRKWFILEDCQSNKNNIASYLNYPKAFQPLEFRGYDDDSEIKSLPSAAISEEDYRNGIVQLINNRRYAFCVMADGYVTYLEYLDIKDVGQVNKVAVLNKPNSVKFNGDISKMFIEMEGLLISGDVLYEYNGQQVNDKNSFLKARKECLQEKVVVKLIRNNKSLSLMIPAYQIFGLENNYYDDKDGILNKGTTLGVSK